MWMQAIEKDRPKKLQTSRSLRGVIVTPLHFALYTNVAITHLHVTLSCQVHTKIASNMLSHYTIIPLMQNKIR